jgi:hypothetical protein
MSRVFSRLSVLVTLLMLAGILAACGGGGDKKDSTPTAASEATPTTSGAVSTPKPIAPTPTKASEEPTPEPTKAVGGSVDVDALWFASDGQSVQGGTSRVTVKVTSKDDQELRVGFFESEVGGSGPQWRAAGWMAVITSSLLLGNDPSHYEFSFDVAGRIDGPSAGALMTIAVLADYLGDSINPARCHHDRHDQPGRHDRPGRRHPAQARRGRGGRQEDRARAGWPALRL